MDITARKWKFDERFWLQAILLIVCVFTLADLRDDVSEGATFWHLAGEGAVALITAAAVIYLYLKNRRLRSVVAIHENTLDLKQKEIESWRRDASEHLSGLGEQIDRQLSQWMMTPAEKEVALLLLKGLSLKEIAAIRGVGEKTVRTQSLAVYAKSNLSGRAELSAFFLEDLLLPVSSVQVSPRT